MVTAAIPQKAFVDVFLMLRDRAGRLLFGLRAGHLYAGGHWNLISGKADEGEDVVAAVIREAAEEVVLALPPDDLQPLGVVHIRPDDGGARVGFAFVVDYDPASHGEVLNGEPHKCDRLVWAPPGQAPQPLEEYNRAVLGLLSRQTVVSVHGWGVNQPSGHPG